MIFRILVGLGVLTALPLHAAPTREEVVATMTRATNAFVEKTSLEGGFVYYVTLEGRRLGEGEATTTEIWVQPPATPAVGEALLDAYEASGDGFFLEVALKAGKALGYGQLESGGWRNSIDFDPSGPRIDQYRNGKGKGKGEQSFSAPVPGEKAPEGQSGSGLGMSDQAKDGQGQDGMLSAPIPGMTPGQTAPGAGLAVGNGASNQSGQGGDQAGTGTAPMEDAKSELLKAKSDSEVVATAGKEGDSTVRSVEGEARAEQATRTRQEVMADFIAVEEQALDEQSLPLSRRQQVLRYFSALRTQFEKAEP